MKVEAGHVAALDKLASAVRPRTGGDVFTYKLYAPDGDEIGQATYPQMIKPGRNSSPAAGDGSASLR